MAPVDLPDGDGREINVVQTPNVDAPEVRRCARSAERKHTAGKAEIVLRGPRMPLVHGELLEGRQKPEAGFLDAIAQRAAFPTDGAVTDTDMIEIRIDLEANLSAVT